jgi:curli biogenesis system outer membrane secretion channel CsgG
MRKALITLAALALAPALVACASAGAAMGPSEYAQLQASCEQRGGHLEMSGRHTAYEALNNYCKLSDPTKQAPPRDN